MQTKTDRAWSVQDAKAKLSEVLRRARDEGPQIVGASRPCVVVALEVWERLQPARPTLGRWLVGNAPRGEPIELPDRREPDRSLTLDVRRGE